MSGAGGQLDIVPFAERHAEAFRDLNLAWVSKLFVVEGPDREQLEHPVKHIIDPGGAILIAEIDGRAVGTCAILAAGGDEYELAKMCVVPELQGQGIGRRLLESALEWARTRDARAVTLLSHSKLKSALALYHKYGFRLVPHEGGAGGYEQCNVAMRLDLQPV